MSFHDPLGVLVTVTKSAVKKMLETFSISRISAMNVSDVSAPLTTVAGPPTGWPTVNLRALGLGVGSCLTAMGRG